MSDRLLHHDLAGTGRPAFVLVHGGMCDHRDWHRLTPLLTPHRAVLTLDLPAHGRSPADPATFSVERCAVAVNALIDTLGLAPAILVGHSFGARVAAEAAFARPDNAAGLVLLDGSRAHGGHAAPRRTDAPPLPLADILTETIGPYLAGSDRARVLATMSSATPALMGACVAAIERWDTARADRVCAGLAMPVLSIQSTYHDSATPRRSLTDTDTTTPYLEDLRASVPTLTIRLLPHTGHFSMIERPAEIAASLHAFAGQDIA